MTEGPQPLFPLPRGGESDGIQSSYPQIDQSSYPPSGGTPREPSAHPTDPAALSRANPKVWAGLAAALAVVIGLVAVAFALSRSGEESVPSTTSDTPTRYANPDHDTPSISTQPRWIDSAVPPPLVLDPDVFGETCGSGYQLPAKTGWGTRSGRGSSETSCYFAHSVLEAYWHQYPSPSEDSRVVISAGTVPCTSTGGECSADQYVMRCAVYGGDSWITCTGGKNARVYIY